MQVPRLDFQGFALGKMDDGLDSSIRALTPYLAASHYMNKIRTPMDNSYM